MTELDLIIDLHKNSERQGPGSVEETLKALSFMDFPAERNLKIADIGCGSGGQTITLAQNIAGQIIGVDIFPEFLNILNRKAKALNLQDSISTLEQSMDDLPFEKNQLDVIWSEGAIYNIGFEKGIKLWRDYLRIGGYLAVSEVTWITNTRPKEIEEFWLREYPEIDTASNKIKQLEDNGYTLAGYFYLKQESWLENYYQPLQVSFKQFLEKHHHSELAQKIVQDHQAEIDLYTKYKDYYSYGFYVARKN